MKGIVTALKILVHLLPLWPLFLGRPFMGLALAAAVLLPYVKVAKLSAQLDAFQMAGVDKEGTAELETLRRRWRRLTLAEAWLSYRKRV